MVDGRRKGNSFEVEVAYLVADWIVPVSGGWKGQGAPPPFRRRPADKDSLPSDWVGGRDIMHHPRVWFPFSVECKNDEDWSIDTLFMRPRRSNVLWWEQCCHQAGAIGLVPLLLLGKARAESMAVLSERAYAAMGLDVDRYVRFSIGGETLRLLPLEDLVLVAPKTLRRLTAMFSPNAQTGGGTGGSLRSRLGV